MRQGDRLKRDHLGRGIRMGGGTPIEEMEGAGGIDLTLRPLIESQSRTVFLRFHTRKLSYQGFLK